VRTVNLATCRTTKTRPLVHPSVGGATVRVTPTSQTIVFRGKVVLKIPERNGLPGPIEIYGLSPDRKWALFAIDPDASASMAADGLLLRAVPIAGGGPRSVAFGLMYGDYRTWCGDRLVLTAGGDRIAPDRKRLMVAGPPSWHARPLARAPGRSFGAVTCAPDGKSVVAQLQRQSVDARFFDTSWALWRIGLDGSMKQLTHPPKGYADESPRFSRDGRTLMFVRSRKGVGKLYALRNGKLVGPLLGLGYSLGFYGHQDWWQSMSWSLAG
jgi:hypothetical protein